MFELSSEDNTRYSRNILLAEIGAEGQQKLLNSSVLVVGAGALGSIVSMYLAASGIGNIGIVDYDKIDISNLQRQLSFDETNIGQFKSVAIGQKLKAINSGISISIYNEKLTDKNIETIIADYDMIIEGSDNPDTKYLVTDACARLKKTCCLGGVAQFNGQVMTILPDSVKYRTIFPQKSEVGEYMPCSVGGVFGPLPGIVGSIQASEAIKYFTGVGDLLSDKILLIDSLNMSFQIIRL